MNKRFLMIMLSGLILMWSCQDDDKDMVVPPDLSITARIGETEIKYEQTVFDGGSNGAVNVYNRSDQTLFLQSFKNGIDDSMGFWTIRIQGLDIESLELPYTLQGVEGSVAWVDEKVKQLQGPCSREDVLCFYSGAGVDDVNIRIDKIENNIISGAFDGKLYHIRVNPSVIRDVDDFSEVVDGSFNIEFQSN